jgi:hypothetical protein
VVAGWVTVSCVVVVVVSLGCEAQELRSVMTRSASTGVRIISFFIVKLILPRRIRSRLLSQMY